MDKDRLASLGLMVRPLEWEETWFVVHASGAFSFFMSSEAAEDYAYNIDRYAYAYNDAAVAKWGERLRERKEAWEREEKDVHERHILWNILRKPTENVGTQENHVGTHEK